MSAGHRTVMLAILAAFVALTSLPSFAVQPDEILADPALEKRARALSAGLRCLVCQNQSIDDSDAPLAGDLRRLVRERLQAHDSDQQVLDFVVARYGDFVLLKPPFTPGTVLLWLSPIVVLLGGLIVMLRARSGAPDESRFDSLTVAERERLSALLNDDKN